MILDKGDYQIMQRTGLERVTIFRKGEVKPYKQIPAKKDLSVYELEKILELYTMTEANNDNNR